MITVLHLITCLDVGGAETLLHDLVVRSDRSMFRHVVVSMLDKGPIGERMRSSGITVYALGMHRGQPTVDAALEFRSILRSESPDILQTWLYHADLLGTLSVRLWGGPPLVWSIHAANMDMSDYRRLSRWVRRGCSWLSGIPNVIIANTEVSRSDHLKLGYHPQQWKLVPNGFDVGKFHIDPLARSSVRQELGLGEDVLLIGMFARYAPQKDHATFLCAAAELLQTEQSVHFVLAGNGINPENHDLSALLTSLDLRDHVHLLGLRRDVARLNAAMDIVSLSSAYGESFSNSIAEAMACGVPCVVTETGFPPHLVGDTGAVVPPRDSHALAEAWREMIAVGAEERKRRGLCARQRIEENYTLDRMVKGYEETYLSLFAN